MNTILNDFACASHKWQRDTPMTKKEGKSRRHHTRLAVVGNAELLHSQFGKMPDANAQWIEGSPILEGRTHALLTPSLHVFGAI